MHLRLRTMGTGQDGLLVCLLDYGDGALSVTPRVTIAGILPTISRLQAPLLLSSGTQIPSVYSPTLETLENTYVLDHTSYERLESGWNIWGAMTESLPEILARLMSMRVWAYYRRVDTPRTPLAEEILSQGASALGSRYLMPSSLSEPLSWYGESVDVADCDPAEGFAVDLRYAGLLPLLPPTQDVYYVSPLPCFGGAYWLPDSVNPGSKRYTLHVFQWTIQDYRGWLCKQVAVSCVDAIIQDDGSFLPVADRPDHTYEALGWHFGLSTPLPAGAWAAGLHGIPLSDHSGVGGWLSSYSMIREHVNARVYCNDAPVLSAPLDGVALDVAPVRPSTLPVMGKPLRGPGLSGITPGVAIVLDGSDRDGLYYGDEPITIGS